MTAEEPRLVYLDCDAGIDDALAIAYLLASPDARLVGIGTVSGNCSALMAARNCAALLEMGGVARGLSGGALGGDGGIPIAVGAHDFLASRFSGGSPHVHGEDGLGNIELAAGVRGGFGEGLGGGVGGGVGESLDEDAAGLLVRLAHAHPGTLHVVAIGPLTNLALALERDPGIADLVAGVTVMGGAALVPGNVTAVAEANIWHDPEAAQRVVEAAWPVTLVPLDVTMTQRISEAQRVRLECSEHAMHAAIGRALEFYFDFYRTHFLERSAALHDPLAVAIALEHVPLTFAPEVSVVVDTGSGPGRGQTICDLRGMYRGAFASAAPTRVVLRIDEAFSERLLRVLACADR